MGTEQFGLQAGLRPYMCNRRILPAKAPNFNNSGISCCKDESKRSSCTPSEMQPDGSPGVAAEEEARELGLTIPARGRTPQIARRHPSGDGGFAGIRA